MKPEVIKAAKLITKTFYDNLFGYSLKDNGFKLPVSSFEYLNDIDNLPFEDIIRFTNDWRSDKFVVYVKFSFDSINKTYSVNVTVYDVNSINKKIANFEFSEMTDIWKLTKLTSLFISNIVLNF